MIVSSAQANGKLRPDLPFLFNAAKKLGSAHNEVALFCSNKAAAEEYRKEIASFAAPAKIHLLNSPTGLTIDTASDMVHKIMGKTNAFTHILAPHYSFCKDLIPRLAGKLDIQPITDVISIQSHEEFERQIYSGNAVARVKSTEPIKLLTIRGHRFTGGSNEPQSSIDSIALAIAEASESSTKLMKSMGVVVADSSSNNIDMAKVVLCGGRGIKAKKDFELLYELSKVLPNAAVGASRGAVDDGFAKYEQQVGQSGKCLTSDVYIGIGVSGALQHLAGIVDVKTVVAINTDPEANLIKVADYYVVGDAVKILPELMEKSRSLTKKQ